MINFFDRVKKIDENIYFAILFTKKMLPENGTSYFQVPILTTAIYLISQKFSLRYS